MTNIIIYTTPEKLLHKQGKLENDPDYSETGYYVWYFVRMPKDVEDLDRVYFATRGFIVGYFIINEVCRGPDENYIEWNCNSWKDIDPIPIKHFQGFKYFKESV